MAGAAVGTGAKARRSTSTHTRSSRAGFRFAGQLFVLPLTLIVVVLFLAPLGILFFMSTQDWPLLGRPTPAGLDNFAAIFDNELFVGAITFTLLYTVLTTILVFAVSFILVAISNTPRRGAKFYRTTFFLPYVVGTASAALIWLAAVNDSNGIANHLLQTVGITDGPWGCCWCCPSPARCSPSTSSRS